LNVQSKDLASHIANGVVVTDVLNNLGVNVLRRRSAVDASDLNVQSKDLASHIANKVVVANNLNNPTVDVASGL
ncbi:hypothetical protein BDF21DRAFT_425064, partial [Thamnidium elegans]